MLFSSWLRNWKRSASTGRRRTPTSPRQRASFRPRLEALEDRVVPSATGYLQTNLTANPNTSQLQANHSDPNLNGWGMTSLPNGQFAVSNTFANGTATLYSQSGAALPLSITVPASTVERDPAVKDLVDLLGLNTSVGHPTGVVYNPTNDFKITENGKTAPATLIFDSIDGTISGWNPAVDPTHAILIRDTWANYVNHQGGRSVYTGLEIGQDSQGNNVLYAADFLNNDVEVIGGDFSTIKTISGKDQGVPGDSASWVWSVQAVGNQLFVTFADLLGSTPGNGAVDVLDPNTSNWTQIDATSANSNYLHNPWGITQAPANFGQYSNDLLVGNVAGDGNINAYQLVDGQYQHVGQLTQPDDSPIAIKGLWDMEFGQGGQLFFDAGPNHPGDQFGGLFGVITPVQPAKAAAIMSASMMPTSTSPTSTTPTSTTPTSTISSPNGMLAQPIDAIFQEFDAVLSSLESSATAMDPQLSGFFAMFNSNVDALESTVLDRLDALETA